MSPYKLPVLGCVDRKSRRLEPGHQCLTTHAYIKYSIPCQWEGGASGDSMAGAEVEQRTTAMIIFGQDYRFRHHPAFFTWAV